MANVESPQLFRLPRPQVGMPATKCVWVCEMLTIEVLWVTIVVLHRGKDTPTLIHSGNNITTRMLWLTCTQSCP